MRCITAGGRQRDVPSAASNVLTDPFVVCPITSNAICFAFLPLLSLLFARRRQEIARSIAIFTSFSQQPPGAALESRTVMALDLSFLEAPSRGSAPSFGVPDLAVDAVMPIPPVESVSAGPGCSAACLPASSASTCVCVSMCL